MIRPPQRQLRNELGDLSSLMASIAENGLIQPILVRPKDSEFEIVCGHRRFEACRKLRLKEIPCIVEHLSDQKAFEAGLIENLQRESLDPMDEARAYQKYVLELGWGSITKLAKRIGKSEEYVSHRLLLLNLPESGKSKLTDRSLSTSKARELVWLKEPTLQIQMLEEIIDRRLSTRETHEAVSLVRRGVRVSDAAEQVDRDSWSADYKEERPQADAVLMEKAITVLRISMMRIDNIIEKTNSEQVRKYLIYSRFGIHELIGECLKRKKELWG